MDGIPFVGTPDSIAAEMAEAMAEIGGDGFLFTAPLSRRSIAEITDGLVPVLQSRGDVRQAYERQTLRETLMEFSTCIGKRSLLYFDMGRPLFTVTVDTCGWRDWRRPQPSLSRRLRSPKRRSLVSEPSHLASG